MADDIRAQVEALPGWQKPELLGKFDDLSFPEAGFGTKLAPGTGRSQTASTWAAGQERRPSQNRSRVVTFDIEVALFDESQPELTASFSPSVLRACMLDRVPCFVGIIHESP